MIIGAWVKRNINCTPGLYTYDVCLSSFVHYRFASIIPFYGIFINLQYFGSNIFLFQVIFGALTALARYLALLALNHVGRRPSQMFFMYLLGLSILCNIFVPQGERRLDFGERKCLFPFLRDYINHICQKSEVHKGSS